MSNIDDKNISFDLSLEKDTTEPHPVENITNGISQWVGTAMRNISLTVGVNMKEIIVNKIRNLPPLPKTIIEVNRIKNSREPDNKELLKILSNDALVTASIMKVANSAMYGFRGKIENLDRALIMFGFNMVTNIAISTAIVSYLKPNLWPYGVDMETFNGTSALQSKIIDKWIDPKISSIKNELQFAAFLQEVGIIIFSIIILEKNLMKNFQDAVEEYQDTTLVEDMLFGQSTSEVSSMIFSHWKFNQRMIDYIKNADKPENAAEVYKVGSQALKIAKTLAPIGQKGATPESIEKAKELVKMYDFDLVSFEKLVDWINDIE